MNEAPAELPGFAPPAIKLLTAAFLLYSSSTSRLLRFRTKRKAPPAITEIASSPTTTPIAMPALLGLEEEDDVEDPAVPVEEEAPAVTTTV